MADSIESTSSLSKLIDLLPLIIISVIVLIGFFTWEIFTKHLEPFILLITSILFAIWLYSGDIRSYVDWKNKPGIILFTRPEGDTPEITNMMISIIVVCVVILVIGLTIGISSYQIGNQIGSTSKHDNILSYIGYGSLGFGGITLLSLLWQAFKEESKLDPKTESVDNNDDKIIFDSTIFKVISGLLLSVVGIYLIARFSIIGASIGLKSVEKDQVNDSSTKENSLSIANTVLNSGLIMQVCAILAGLYMMYRYKLFHLDASESNVITANIKYIPFVISLIVGIIFFARTGTDDDNKNTYIAHGIVYMVLAAITLLMALGNLSKFTLFKGTGLVLAIGFIGVIILNFVTLNEKSNFDLTKDDANNGNAYYRQVRDEVTKELKKSGKPEDITDAKINEKMQQRMGELNVSNDKIVKDINNTLLSFALVIVIAIGLFYAAKMKIVECKKLPVKIHNIFVGGCDEDADFIENKELDTALSNKPENIETITGDKWDKIIESNTNDKFSGFAVKLARASRWNPFLTIILVILCVSMLFTKVTTSEATMEWIAKSFRGDMFPKVKELLDTFFIVFIVGLVLCAILLLPMVQEPGGQGLDVITKFIDSIQVWQYKDNYNELGISNVLAGVGGFLVVFIIFGLSWTWKKPLPDNWELIFTAVLLFAVCCIPAFFHSWGGKLHEDFEKDGKFTRILRLFFTSAYLVPLLLLSVFKLIIYFIPWFIGRQFDKSEWKAPFEYEISKWNFTKWKAEDMNQRGTDLRLFGLGKIPIPADVVTSKSAVTTVTSAPNANATAAPAAAAPAPNVTAPAASSESVDQTKVNAVGKLFKVIFIVIAFVVLILTIIYTVYKIDADIKQPGEDTSNYEDVTKKLSSPTAYTMYAIIGIVGIAGLVAYLREKFKTANQKNPEDYLFDDLKPEDSNNPMRQLTFGMTHIIYIVLMIVVWIYDTEKDDKNRMSVTGMTVLGILILFFHYILEFVDNKLPQKLGSGEQDENTQGNDSPSLVSNIRFIINTVFLIILSVLAYYKQHGVMVALIVIMFIFHLTKSILGVKLLKLLWACIIYIPCLFLDLVQNFQGTVGDTSRTIWIIVAIELLLIAILYGGPYLVNYIGASSSQIVAAPISIKQKYDTNLTTQSKEIFIYHNTRIDRTPEDAAANCPPEEKKRYNYGISGWFFLNNNVTTASSDLEIFNFGDVPKMTYNPSKNELKIFCNTLDTKQGGNVGNVPRTEEIYNSRLNNNAMAIAQRSSEQKKTALQMTIEGEELDADIPLQRWNYFVINYDGKNMDFFINNKLIFKSKFIMPDIQLKSITVGHTNNNQGLNGRICNFAFHKIPLTKEQIRWTYNMLKTQDPPMIGGMKTVEDEIKTTGSTNVYS
jgi:hypothetical protein